MVPRQLVSASEQIQIPENEDEGVEDLGEEGDTWDLVSLIYCNLSICLPSALLL